MALHTCKNCNIKFNSDLHTVYCDNCRTFIKKKVKCSICNNDFEVGFGINGQFLQTKICPNCAKPSTKQVQCKNCGKMFTIGRYADGKYQKRRVCDDCLKPKEYKDVVCKKCGKIFKIPIKSGRVLCEDCVLLSKTKELRCKRCGKTIIVNRRPDNHGFYERSFCSECLKPPETKNLICKNCGKQFTVDRYDDNQSESNIQKTPEFKRRLYCSDSCRREGRKKKIQDTYIQKYGVPYYFYTNEYKEKTIQTCQKKYGVDFPCMSDNCINAQGNIISKINIDFANFLDKYDISYEQEYKIHGYSYDFKLKDTNILLEINPTYTHSCIDTELYKAKHKSYHITKTNYAIKSGYRVIHVWQWDDWNKIIDIIKPKQKLYARKLKINSITKQEANIFLNKYHLQGSCYGNMINLGLYNEDKLVQVMTFGKPRYNKRYEYELLRLCTHSDYMIIGGAERLFKYFVKEYNPQSIISYCDISKFTGNVYERLGFKLIRITEPQKIWSKRASNEYITDNLLRQRGADQLIGTNDGKGTNNEDIMIREDWLPVYDCGQKVFEWI